MLLKSYLNILLIIASINLFSEDYKISPVFISDFAGQINLKDINDNKWNEIDKNFFIYNKSFIKTGDKSFIDIVLNKENKIYLGKKSIIKLEFKFIKESEKEIFDCTIYIFDGTVKLKTLIVENKNRIRTKILNNKNMVILNFISIGDNSIFIYNNMNKNISYLLSENNNLNIFFGIKNKYFLRKNNILSYIDSKILLRKKNNAFIKKYFDYTIRKKIKQDIDLLSGNRKW